MRFAKLVRSELLIPPPNAMRMMAVRTYYVYIMTNAGYTVLYTGVTNNIRRRVNEHRTGQGGRFTRRYNIKKLVYVERYHDVHAAIAREKQIKAGARRSKLDLIRDQNPDWVDWGEQLEG